MEYCETAADRVFPFYTIYWYCPTCKYMWTERTLYPSQRKTALCSEGHDAERYRG